MIQAVAVIVLMLLLDRMSIKVQEAVTKQSPCLVVVHKSLVEPGVRVGLEVYHFGIAIIPKQVGLGLVAWWEVGLD